MSGLGPTTERRARRTGTMVSGSNEAVRARQRKAVSRRKNGRLARHERTAPYATPRGTTRQGRGLSRAAKRKCLTQFLELLLDRVTRRAAGGGAPLDRIPPRR